MTRKFVLLIFVISGALGLGYQVLWSKILLSFIGVSAYSYSIVLAAFMGGLAIGSAYFGKMADRIKCPLKLFAILELGVGLYAIIYQPLTDVVGHFYAQWVSFVPEQSGAAAGLWFKVLASGILILPPTILMGGTYPTLVRFATTGLQNIGRNASRLYAANAFGASAGALLMAFIILPWLGITGSLMLLALSNAAIAAVAYVISSRGGKESNVEKSNATDIKAEQMEFAGTSAISPKSALFFIFVAGALSFTYEIAWTRFFGIVMGSSTYSFSVMLSAFITGIFIGSYILLRLDHKIRNPLHVFGWAQLVAGILVLAPLPFYTYFPWFFDRYGNLLSDSSLSFYVYEGGKLMFCYLLMLPPTIFIGVSVPLMVKGFAQEAKGVGKDTGVVYSWNTWGNVFGALVAGLILFSLLGMEGILRSSACLSIFMGGYIIFRYAPVPYSPVFRRARTSVIALTAIAVILSIFVGSWNPVWFRINPYRRDATFQSLRDVSNYFERFSTPVFLDDPSGNLMVSASSDSELVLYVNGKPDASSSGDMPTQLLLGHVPLIIHPEAKDVCIVGLASGVTSGAILRHPVKRLDVVEILRSMPKATKLFEPWNGDPFSDNRFNLIIDDARNYLTYTQQDYDLIISEPSNPWVSGVGSMFSDEFYQKVTSALRDNGIFLQWMQGYEIGDELFTAVIRTFRKSFPYIYVFQGNSRDFFLMGSKQEIKPDWEKMKKRMHIDKVSEQLDQVHVKSLGDLLFLQRLSPPSVDYIASLTSVENNDDNLLLEYNAPRDLFQRFSTTLPDKLDERLRVSPTLFWSQYLREHPDEIEPESILDMIFYKQIYSKHLGEAYLEAYFYLAGNKMNRLSPDILSKVPSHVLNEMPFSKELLVNYIYSLIKAGHYSNAIIHLEQHIPGIYLASGLSDNQADYWEGHFDKWIDLTAGSALEQQFKRFRNSLWVATGQTDKAGEDLVKLLNSDPAWTILQAGYIDAKVLRPKFVYTYLMQPTRPWWIHRFYALTDSKNK